MYMNIQRPFDIIHAEHLPSLPGPFVHALRPKMPGGLKEMPAVSAPREDAVDVEKQIIGLIESMRDLLVNDSLSLADIISVDIVMADLHGDVRALHGAYWKAFSKYFPARTIIGLSPEQIERKYPDTPENTRILMQATAWDPRLETNDPEGRPQVPILTSGIIGLHTHADIFPNLPFAELRLASHYAGHVLRAAGLEGTSAADKMRVFVKEGTKYGEGEIVYDEGDIQLVKALPMNATSQVQAIAWTPLKPKE